MDLNNFFYPKKIAIIGASNNPGSIGLSLFKNLSNFDIYPVNPNLPDILGHQCYPKITDVPFDIDLAIIAVPARYVPIVVDEVANTNIKNIIVISSGFNEVGRSDLEDLVKLICQKNNINLLGPNCLGVINPENLLNASFARTSPQFGNIALLSQSGAICTTIIDSSLKLGLGFSKFVSLGNKAILNENDFLTYFNSDPKTSVIGIYSEQLTSPSVLFDMTKPVIILKSGRTDAGKQAARSHTGAIAGNDSAYDALFTQSGAIRANTLSEFINYLTVFSQNQLPNGSSISIITNAGGVGVLASDAAANNKLTVTNVVDLLGDATASDYSEAINTAISDNLLVILTPQSVTQIEETAKVLIDFKQKSKKPLVACFLGATSVENSITLLRKNGVSVIDFPESAVNSLAAFIRYSEFTRRPTREPFPRYELTDTQNLLESYGIPVLHSQLAKSADEAVNIANHINKNMVLKISSPDISHKSDFGGVVLNISQSNIKSEYSKLVSKVKALLPFAKINGVLVEEEYDRKKGIEIILGSSLDPTLGQTIMVGYGGIYTEIIKDVSFGLVPISKSDAIDMVSKLKIKKIIDGARGGPILDHEAVVDCLGRLSQLLLEHPEIKELDINPLFVGAVGEGVKVLDYRIVNI